MSPVELHEGHGRLPAGVLHQPHRVLRQSGLGQPVAQERAAMARVGARWPTTSPGAATALPDFRHSPAASLVTLGRFS